MKRISALILLIVFFSIFTATLFQAQAQETITIATYYPSPAGVYQRLVTSTLGVGDNDGSGQVTNTDSPDPTNVAQQGDVWIAGDVGIKTGIAGPQRTLHVAGTDGMRLAPSGRPGSPAVGDIVVDSSDSNTLKWYNGTDWAAAGGGTCYVAYFSYVKDPYPYSAPSGIGWTTPHGTIDASYPYNKCLTGFTDQGSLGPYGGCFYNTGYSDFSYFLPPGSKCDTGSYGYGADSPFYIGEGHLCCK